MRILHVSKFAQVTGGVERHMLDLVQLQTQAGHQTEIFSSEFRGSTLSLNPSEATVAGAAQATARILWADDARRSLKKHIRGFAPDVVHFHSVYHQLSASVLHSVPKSASAVMTLHDYKLAAPCYLLLRDGQPCIECVGSTFPFPAVHHRCVKDSRAASLVCATEQVVHVRSYRTKVDRFIVPSLFAASLLSRSRAVPQDRVVVVPHGIPMPPAKARPSESRRFVFLGRLSSEKGLEDLLAAWDTSGVGEAGYSLDVVGDGPAAGLLKGAPASVVHKGWLDRPAVASCLASARCVVIPSRFHETFGLSAAEALAAGVPLIAARSGALSELVENSAAGALFQPGNRAELSRLLEEHSQSAFGPELNARGLAGRDFVSRKLSPALMLERTLDVYREAARTRGGDLQ